jgi:predicted N-acetyltransferase YhbS
MDPKIIMKIITRNEIDADVDAIAEVTGAAFMTLEISNHTEQFIIEALRADNALTVSLIAEVDGHVVGHEGYWGRSSDSRFTKFKLSDTWLTCLQKPE